MTAREITELAAILVEHDGAALKVTKGRRDEHQRGSASYRLWNAIAGAASRRFRAIAHERSPLHRYSEPLKDPKTPRFSMLQDSLPVAEAIAKPRSCLGANGTPDSAARATGTEETSATIINLISQKCNRPAADQQKGTVSAQYLLDQHPSLNHRCLS
jgi:hypothetical protein